MLVAVLDACVIPVPVQEVSNEVSEQSLAAIEPSASTRADVLLLLGEPTIRGDGDRHFVYSWRKSHGGALVAFPYPVGGGVGKSCHCLVIRFAPNGGVAKVKVFHGEVHVEGFFLGADIPGSDVCTRDTALTAAIKEWLAEPPAAGE
jgi:outer membrane protein assembly factor BamE (lipoprotein component of BamABCDE complex)